MKTIIKLLRRAFAPHQWKHEGEHRTCTTCGRRDAYVQDDPSGYWDTTSAGDRSKHA